MLTACTKKPIEPPTEPVTIKKLKTELLYKGTPIDQENGVLITKTVGDLQLVMKYDPASIELLPFKKTIKLRLLDEFGNQVLQFANLSDTSNSIKVPFSLPVERKQYMYEYEIIPEEFVENAFPEQLIKTFPLKREITYTFQSGNNIQLGPGVSSGTITIIGNDTATRKASVYLKDGASTQTICTNQTVAGNTYTFNVTGVQPNKVYILEVNLNNGLYILQANIRQ